MEQSPEELGLRPDLSLLPIEVRDLILYGNRCQYPDHSEAAAAVCATMFQAKYAADEIWMVMTDPTNDISKEFFSKDATQAEDWLERIVCEAYEAVDRSQGGDG